MKDDDLKKMVSPELWEMAQRDSRLQIVRPGGAVSTLEDMRQRKTNLTAQVDGCWTLAKKCLRYDDKIQVCGGNGVATILNAMKQHAWNSSLHQVALAVLRILGTLDRGKERLMEQRAIEPIASAMLRHVTDVVVQQNGCVLIAMLYLYSKSKTSETRAVEAVVEAMRGHPKDMTIQHRGCLALRCLCANEDNVGDMVDNGGIRIVSKAVKCHPAVPEVQQVGVAVLDILQEWRRLNPGWGPWLWFAGGSILITCVLFVALLLYFQDPSGIVPSLIISVVVALSSMAVLRWQDLL